MTATEHSLATLWKTRTHNLGRMDMAELIRAFVTYPTVLAYVLYALISLGVTIYLLPGASMLRLAIAVALAIAVYPMAWYLIHRFMLHGQYLYKSRWTAATWKRIHFDHHQDPHDLRVLFGTLYTTLPTIAIITITVGWLVAGPAGGAVAFATGLLTTIFYEFAHCVQHLNTTPKSKYMQRVKRLHLAHHFHNEQGNFGITNFIWDRLLGTYYGKAKNVGRSATVFNLGYTAEMAEKYPWVQVLSGGVRRDGGPWPAGDDRTAGGEMAAGGGTATAGS
jgi:sterol desaturase/sphingolipid hydroxylase (fatty acid hydroxylase superfamily)